MSAKELARLAQNPVGNLISVPFQNNTNLNYGPEKGTALASLYEILPGARSLTKASLSNRT